MAKSTYSFKQQLHPLLAIRLRVFLSLLFLVLLSSTVFAQGGGGGGGKQPPPPTDPGRGGTIWGFEVDADFRANFIPAFWTPSTAYDPDYNPKYYPNLTTFGVDWRSLLTYNPTTHRFSAAAGDLRTVGKVDGNWGNKSVTPEVVSFAGNSNKNSDLIGPGLVTSSYTLQAGGTGPQKNDITNTFLHSRDYNDSVILVYAVETRATNGASFVDFEYNQAGAKIDSTNGLHLVGNGLVGGRTVGDFLLIVDYVGGGATPIVSARTWLASGQWSDSIGIDQLNAFIAANVFNVQALDSLQKSSYTDDGAPSGTCKALQMVEGAVNLTYLKSRFPGFAALNLCSPNATVTVKTRSSPSFTSELKDLDIIPFSIIPGPPGNNTSQIACPDTVGGTYATFDLRSAVSSVINSGGFVQGWYKDVGFTQQISDSSAYKAANGTVVYAKLENSEGCLSTAADTLKVRTSPSAPSTTYNAPACDSAYFTVTVSGVVQGVTYEIRNKDGGLISGLKVNYSTAATTGSYTAPSNSSFKFTNIPAGAGYRIRAVDANTCPSVADSCGAPSGTPAWVTKADQPANEEKLQTNDRMTEIMAKIQGRTKVLAAPNPFTDRVRFSLQSDVSGQGSLEIFNTVGQKVATVYQGYVEAGKTLNKEYVVKRAQRAELIYIFRVGDQKTTGKLLNW